MNLSWLSAGRLTELRFILVHNKDIEDYFYNLHLRRKIEYHNVELFLDRVQDKRRATAGYLAGPIISDISANTLADMLVQSPIFTINRIDQVEIFEYTIATVPVRGARLSEIKKSRRIKATHVCAQDLMKARARSCLSSTFPSKVKPHYPLRIHFRFIPNTRDPDFPVPPEARDIANHLMHK